jgi:integrase
MTTKSIQTPLGNTVQQTKNGLRLRVKYNKRQYYFPLGSKVAEGLRKADDIKHDLRGGMTIDQVREKHHPAQASHGIHDPTVDELLAIYKQAYASILGQSVSTYKNYSYALRWFASRLTGKDTDQVGDVRLSKFLAIPLLCVKQEFTSDLICDDLVSAKISFNTYLGQLKGLFKKSSRNTLALLFKRENLNVCFDRLMQELDHIDPYPKAKKVWKGIQERFISKIMSAIRTCPDVNIRTACTLALHAGLRKNEIRHARFDWMAYKTDPIETHHLMWVVMGNGFTPKGREGHTLIHKKVWDRMVKGMAGNLVFEVSGQWAGRKEFLVSNPTDNFFKKVNAFLRTCCPNWHPDKPLHELRRLFGCYVANRHNLFLAQQYLRHADPKTTYDSYANITLSEDCLKLWEK